MRRLILTALATLGLWPGVAAAQIDVNEIDLHNGEIVYGLDAPGTPIPYVNLEAINLWAWGDDDPNYTDVSFYAYGLYGDNDLANSGAIDVNAVGGVSTTTSAAIADANTYASGVYGPSNDVNNTGTVTVSVTGGTADITGSGTVQAQASGLAYGVRSTADIDNGAAVTVSVESGSATAASGDNPEAYADAEANGLYGSLAELTNTHPITVVATGGTAEANGGEALASANAEAYGLRPGWSTGTFNTVSNSGEVTVSATGGTATVDGDINDYGGNKAYAEATARGLNAHGTATNRATVANDSDVNVSAIGGTADANNPVAYTSAKATAQGFFGVNSTVDNRGDITVVAHGGTLLNQGTHLNGAQNNADARGLWLGSSTLTNRGTLTVTANGGTGGQNTSSSSQGILAEDSVIDNRGTINVASNGGTAQFLDARFYADALADASALGIYGTELHIDNTSTITSTATAGRADGGSVGWATANASAAGIVADSYDYDPTDGIEPDRSNVNSSDAITLVATGGTAEANDYDASANASANGIAVYYGDVVNDGAIHATALAGQADVNGTGTAQATGEAYGVYVLSGSLDNTSLIDVNAVGGTATALEGIADANAYAYGLYSDSNDVSNTGTVTASARAGTADANALATAATNAVGIYSGAAVTNHGALTVTATGGTADANWADVTFHVAGIDADGDVNNTGAAAVIMEGGSATGADLDAYNEVNAYGRIYGIRSESGSSLDNAGAITIVADGRTALVNGDTADATLIANALYAEAGDVNNTGAIEFSVTGGSAEANSNMSMDYADADVTAKAISADGTVANNGAITAVVHGGTTDARGLADACAETDVYGVSGDQGVDNTGAIQITVDGGTAEAASGAADADLAVGGLRTYRGDLNNTGAITITATGGSADVSSTSSSAHASAKTTVTAIHSSCDEVNNSGAITSVVQGGSADTKGAGPAYAEAWTYGIGAYYAVDNTGPIDLDVTGGTAQANEGSAYAYGVAYGIETENTVTNAGAIDVSAIGGTADSNEANAIAYAKAFGIHTCDTVTNAGAIAVSATGGTATGNYTDADAYAYGIRGDGNIVNTGNITASATAQDGSTSYAFGIYLENGTLTQSGTVRALADEAYELYAAAGTTTLFDTYNVTLDGDPNDASIFVADSATLALNDATLTVTDVSGETLWDTEYRLFEADPNGAVTGQFAEADAVNPDATATYYDQETSNAADDTVALTYDPEAAEPTNSSAVEKQIVFQANDIVNRRMTGALLQNILSPTTSALLADAGSTAESMALARSAPKKRSGAYVEPYYSRLNKDADPLGYKARLWGFAAGYEQSVENTLFGLHAGYGQSDISYTGVGYSANREDQDVLTVGATGLTRWDPWTLRYGVTGFYGWHDYTGLTGVSLDERETASYNSHGAAAMVMVGRVVRRDQHVFLPEVGLSYLWSHRNRYTTTATDPSWNTTYSALDDHDVQAEAALRWLSRFMHDDIRVTPSVSVGVRHLLTDNETGAWMSVPGAAPVLVKSERDRTALTLSGSLTLTQARHALSVAYDGEYANDSRCHSLWMRYSWQF